MTLHAIYTPKPSIPAGSRPLSAALANALYRISNEQYHRMIEQGILPDRTPTELLHGLVVWKDRGSYGEDLIGHSPDHVLVVSLISALAARINSLQRHLKIQLPVDVGMGEEPEPDGAIVRGQPRDYAGRIPAGADVHCVIEVAATSLERDCDDKLPAYAMAGIPQYIIVNLRAMQVEAYSNPDASGVYRTKIVAGKGDPVHLNLGNGDSLEIMAAELLP